MIYYCNSTGVVRRYEGKVCYTWNGCWNKGHFKEGWVKCLPYYEVITEEKLEEITKCKI